MKAKIYSILFAAASVFGYTSCDSLDLVPESSIVDSGYWQDADQFNAFHTGISSYLRDQSYSLYVLGELRSNIFNGVPFGGEATQGVENVYYNTLSAVNPGVSNYGNFYNIINQINLMIAKAEETTLITEANKNYYLGESYGLRAYLYFHLLRSYGDVILYTDYTSGTTLDLSNLNRTQDSAETVMAQIKSDIASSEAAFGSDYAFTKGKNFWSLGATKMLKGEVYLWSGKQMGGGTSDYQTALQALQEVKNCPNIALLDSYKDVFSFSKKRNNEVIYAIYNGENEKAMFNGSWRGNFVPQQAYMNSGAYYTESGENVKETSDSQLNGLVRAPLDLELYDDLYLDNDPRKRINLRSVYKADAEGNIAYVGAYPYKYQGTMLAGGSERQWYDDFIIYRYADCLLLMAEAKALLGQDITEEINAVRKRAYGENYSDAVAYPNDKGEFYVDNKFVGSDDDPVEAVLKERLREMIFEGRRWYDIRLFNMTGKYSLATSDKLLWPINTSTLTNNNQLKQTPGY